ncbi:MAG TPA: chemotaxis-specific protein-glutamate methyltransferase CheB [Planctomycetota bacterium]|nr:chemotaxis-specific protein-glutamate methyltransferase CheB [Planctomycetota bacterium]
MSDRPLRVLVVDDSPTVRARIAAALSADAGFAVAGESADGRAALERCVALRPDVVTLDLQMPAMNGVEAAEAIMAFAPTPILVVSSADNRGDLLHTYDALSAGAVDVLEKPRGDAADDDWDRRLRDAVRMAARIRVITHPRARLNAARRAAETAEPAEVAAPSTGAVVALGASTGGPGALRDILGALPRGFPAPIAVVMHVAQAFAAGFVEWLAGRTALSVAQAKDGDPLWTPGRVVVAPAGRHLSIRDGRWRLLETPERHSCRPSVDVLFETAAAELGPRLCACLLTGMGRDGAAGLLAVKNAGGATIAEDESTAVVFGMPREAVQLGAAHQVLPRPRIARALLAFAEARARKATP